MGTFISKGPTLSISQPIPKLRLQFSEQRCYVGCILIPCIDQVGPFEMDEHICVYFYSQFGETKQEKLSSVPTLFYSTLALPEVQDFSIERVSSKNTSTPSLINHK